MIDWNKYDRRLVELDNDQEITSIVEILGILKVEFPEEDFTYDSVQGRLYRLRQRGGLIEKEVPFMPYFERYKDYITGEKRLNKTNIGIVTKRLKFLVGPTNRRKILHLCDLQIPFEDEEAVQKAIDSHITADIVVMSEVLDCYSLSSFWKRKNVPFELEIEKTLRLFEYLNETFPMILLLKSNHDDRVGKQLTKRVPSSLLFMVSSHILEILSRPFKNIYFIDDWFVQIGDALFCHADINSVIDMRAGYNILISFYEWQKTLGIKDFNVIVQGHTHYLGSFHRPGMKIFEGGCLCGELDWHRDKLHKKPWTLGYVAVTQENGKSILNLCREYQL